MPSQENIQMDLTCSDRGEARRINSKPMLKSLGRFDSWGKNTGWVFMPTIRDESDVWIDRTTG